MQHNFFMLQNSAHQRVTNAKRNTSSSLNFTDYYAEKSDLSVDAFQLLLLFLICSTVTSNLQFQSTLDNANLELESRNYKIAVYRSDILFALSESQFEGHFDPLGEARRWRESRNRREHFHSRDMVARTHTYISCVRIFDISPRINVRTHAHVRSHARKQSA